MITLEGWDLDAKRFDLAEQLANVLFKAHEWFGKMKESEKVKNVGFEE